VCNFLKSYVHFLVKQKGDVHIECVSRILVKGDARCGGASPFILHGNALCGNTQHDLWHTYVYICIRMCANGHSVGPAQEAPCGAQAV
jgi:hypothetical protein